MRNVLCYPQCWEESFFGLERLPNTHWSEKSMLTNFILKGYKIGGKKQQLSQHQICCQNIRRQTFLSKHQKR